MNNLLVCKEMNLILFGISLQGFYQGKIHGKTCALKVIDIFKVLSMNKNIKIVTRNIFKEIEAMSMFRHENILEIWGISFFKEFVVITEIC